MGKDYYAILNINRSATLMDIKMAFRKMALKCHPDTCKAQDAKAKFNEIAEAFEVLSGSQTRATYDQFGEEGLKGGIPKDGEYTKGYVFDGNSERVFRQFIGSDNPFADYFALSGLTQPPSFSGVASLIQPKQDPPVEKELQVSLEELYTGSTKKMKISRRVMNDDGVTTSVRDKVLSMNINPGMLAESKIAFSKEGDQGPNKIPSDIIFTLRDKPHAKYTREGVDLLYTANIQLYEALCGCTIALDTLDSRLIKIPINDIVYPGFSKTVPGEGMPHYTDPNVKGDLIISFDISFPARLTEQKKSAIKKILA